MASWAARPRATLPRPPAPHPTPPHPRAPARKAVAPPRACAHATHANASHTNARPCPHILPLRPSQTAARVASAETDAKGLRLASSRH